MLLFRDRILVLAARRAKHELRAQPAHHYGQPPVICTENQLDRLDFGGARVCDWRLGADIRYIKNIAGAANKECIQDRGSL